MADGSGVDSAGLPLVLSTVSSSSDESRSTTTLTLEFCTPDDESLDDVLDFVGVEVPHGWGNVL